MTASASAMYVYRFITTAHTEYTRSETQESRETECNTPNRSWDGRLPIMQWWCLGAFPCILESSPKNVRICHGRAPEARTKLCFESGYLLLRRLQVKVVLLL